MIKLIRRYRRNAYRSAKFLGDVQAIITGKWVQRYVQRKVGALSRRGMNTLIPRRKK